MVRNWFSSKSKPPECGQRSASSPKKAGGSNLKLKTFLIFKDSQGPEELFKFNKWISWGLPTHWKVFTRKRCQECTNGYESQNND